jgi:hypothetical protein
MLFHTIVLCPGLRILKKLKKNLQVPLWGGEGVRNHAGLYIDCSGMH